MTTIQLPKKLQFLLKEKARFKVIYGGRGSAKSSSMARALIIKSLQAKTRILCTRELQNSISDSVHKLLSDIIYSNTLDAYFEITKTSIKSANGSEFIFKGVRNNINEIKSLEGIDICWVEEAQKISETSWDVLIPTIRKSGSEIWICFNPDEKDDPTYKRFVLNPPTNTIAVKINYDDNRWFPETELVAEMEYDKQFRPEIYDNKWLGNVKKVSEALIFKNKFEVREFETPELNQMFENRFFFGLDFGFSSDPTAFIRCFIQDGFLYIDQEAGGIGVEMQQIKPFILDKIPESNKWLIYGDCSRPETIAYIQREGYNIYGCSKWAGSVEEGIEYIRSFKKIIIHPRCKNIIEEFNYYSYKVDKISGAILPVIVDKYNHYCDALRYALDGYIKQKGKIFVF